MRSSRLAVLITHPAVWHNRPIRTSKKSVNFFGRKRRFGLAGAANVIATNILLQILLGIQYFPGYAATLISQVFNGCLGYLIYSRWVFCAQSNHGFRSILSYFILMLFLWGLNALAIQTLVSAVLVSNRNIAALVMIAPLAITSYLIQKNIIFNT